MSSRPPRRITAFLIGPIAELLFIPFMVDGWGAETIGPWFGTGADRGLALVFVVTGVVGLLATLLALRSRSFVRLSQSFAGQGAAGGHDDAAGADAEVDHEVDEVQEASPRRG